MEAAVALREVNEPRRRKLQVTDLERMNLPDKFWTVKIQGVQEPAREVVANYLRKIHKMLSDGIGMLIEGGDGVGKTSIAALALKVARSYGYTGFFDYVWQLRNLIKERVDFDDETSILGRCREVDLLVLDDFSAADMTAAFFGFKDVEALVKYRAGYRKATIITVNPDVGSKVQLLCGIATGRMVELGVTGVNLLDERHKQIQGMVKTQ